MTDRREPQAHPIRDLLSYFDELYSKAHGTRYPFNGGRDSKMMKDLLVLYSDEQIRSYMVAFFEMDDPFIEDTGHSLGAFRGCLPKVIKHVRGRAVKADGYGHNPPCRTHAECVERVVREGREERAKAKAEAET